MTKIKPCSCVHDYQDTVYGKGMRVHNEMASKDPSKFRCTVCGTERT